ncbi:MAG: DUF805 domain-containing protein [Lachnospiraceae bacterium]|nr:DUF805 domain-containing protein [Lachnospiraceae bacterium]
MSFTESIQTVFQKYAVFEGRARRSEYWWFYLAYAIVYAVLSGLSQTLSGSGMGTAVSVLSGIIGLACLVPTIAVTTRRLHDTGKSGWWQLLYLTCIGSIVILIFCALDSQPGDNQYGQNPKEI